MNVMKIMVLLPLLTISLTPTPRWVLLADGTKKPPLKSPLSPQEAIKHFKLTPGLRIELVAAEPQMESPVAMTFDEEAGADAAKR